MSNKAAGTRFEKAFVSILAQHGFWVHPFQDNKNGQPCDVVAARNGSAYLFDCKDCQGSYFELRRAEPNQYNAMYLFEMAGNSRGMFAIRFSNDEIYLVDYRELLTLAGRGIKRIGRDDCVAHAQSLTSWLEYRDSADEWSEWHEDHNWK